MNRKQKYQSIRGMVSMGNFTANEYPSRREFDKAISEGRVCGNYEGPRVRINSNDPYKDYQFMSREFYNRFFCGEETE
jgi:hypothetical protein